MSEPAKMRAKVRVGSVMPYPDASGKVTQETLHFYGVAANSYPADGVDENNSFARWSPSVMFQIVVANPDLLGKFAPGDTFYCDFSPAPK